MVHQRHGCEHAARWPAPRRGGYGNIDFPSPKPKLNLEAIRRCFRSASMMTGDNHGAEMRGAKYQPHMAAYLTVVPAPAKPQSGPFIPDLGRVKPE